MAWSTVQWRSYCCYAFLLVLTASYITRSHSSAAQWWSVGTTDCGKRVQTVNSFCPNCAKLGQMEWFSERQISQCQSEPVIRDSLARGARAAIIDCQRQFNESRWNCPTFYGANLFGSFVATSQTRETGVLNAYMAAAAVWAIAEDCHNQRIASCACIIENIRTETENGDIIFESCKADYTSAANIFQDFTMNQLDTATFPGLIDEWNINVGKKLIDREIQACRCHGISGTCTVQTCYKRVPTVEEVGDILKQRYGGAVKVNNISHGEFININPNRAPPDIETIVYKDNSPSFCKENVEIGTVGVQDRICDPNSNKPNACSTTCCNHGHYTITKTVPIEECKFIWCCDIVCEYVRNDTITEHRCNPPPL